MSDAPVYRGRTIAVHREDVTLPNGHRTRLDIVRHPGAAAIVPFASPGEVLLIRQYRHAAGGVIYEVPAGTLDPGEDAATCAARELEEEVGRRAGRLEPLGAIWTTPGFCDERIHLFAAFELSAVASRHEHDELIEVAPTPLPVALDMVWRGQIADAKSALALLKAARRSGAVS